MKLVVFSVLIIKLVVSYMLAKCSTIKPFYFSFNSVLFYRMKFCSFTQAGLECLGSSDSPVSASQGPGTIVVYCDTWLNVEFDVRKNIKEAKMFLFFSQHRVCH